MSQRCAVVHEAEADFHTATELADRVLRETIGWLDEHLIADQRTWIAQESSGRRLTWTAIAQLARDARVRPHGHFDGKPGEADAAAARRAILYLRATMPDLNAILLIRDSDDQPERRDGLQQARDNVHSGIVIVIGFAIVERECWIISGFDPQDEKEVSLLAVERQKLGFDPRLRSHELTAHKNEHDLRSSKRVLRQLSGGDHVRERRCWLNTPLQQLRERGSENGLTAYLDEIRERLAKLIGYVAEG